MIQKYVDRFMERKADLEAMFAAKHPDSYMDIVSSVIGVIADDENDYSAPSRDRIHVIDDGEYQGTLVYVIGACGYQPSDYWYVKIAYGSCSGCDTLEGIRKYAADPPTQKQVSEYMTLALHIVQCLKKMGDDEA